MKQFLTELEEAADRVTVALDALLPRADGPEARLASAMRYAALGPGKRVRPFLALQAGRLIGAEERALLRISCAIECIHSYSLIHDDLPCMDDDDLRRGRPTVHIAYDEATAAQIQQLREAHGHAQAPPGAPPAQHHQKGPAGGLVQTGPSRHQVPVSTA